MSSLDYQQAYRSHRGQASMSQHRASQGLSLMRDDDYQLPLPAWHGFEYLDENEEWVPIAEEYMAALLSAAGADVNANIERMKAGGVMRLNYRLYRWAGVA